MNRSLPKYENPPPPPPRTDEGKAWLEYHNKEMNKWLDCHNMTVSKKKCCEFIKCAGDVMFLLASLAAFIVSIMAMFFLE